MKGVKLCRTYHPVPNILKHSATKETILFGTEEWKVDKMPVF